MDQTLVQDVVTEVMRQLSSRKPGPRDATAPAARSSQLAVRRHDVGGKTPRPAADGRFGVFSKIADAVTAAEEAQRRLVRLSLQDRDAIVKLVKSIAKQNAQDWGRIEFEETRIGRLDHKIEKLQILELVPGVEFLRTRAASGSDGLTIEEYAPFGVIGIITPVTHSVPTLTANVISMVASGNSVVANAHPTGADCAALAVREYNRAIASQFGIEHLVTCVHPPTLRTAEELFRAKGISLLVVTGGAGVARAALESKKRAIVAGPGNPPVVVDETACLQKAAESIVKGAAYDNNLLCIGEKQVFCVESVFDRLIAEMQKAGSHMLNTTQIEALTKLAFEVDSKHNRVHLNKDLVGQDAGTLAERIGLRVPPATQLLIGETTPDHLFVQEEQMMPFVPLVRCRNVDEAIERAIQSEHGYRHTAVIHSRNLETITRFGREANVTVYVVNGPSMAGLGLGGEGYLSYSIATPTGEGITTPLTFTRFRRITMSGSMRMI
jgi:aldehyde dehydrogenase